MAAYAQSIPLFPAFPPDLSIACSKVKSVDTQKIKGILNKIFKSLIPFATDEQIMSK